MTADILEDWSAGVISAMLPDRLPDGAVPVSKNSQFHHVGPGRAVMGTRDGCLALNGTALTGSVVSQYFLDTDTQDDHLVVTSDGKLAKVVNGTSTTIQSSAFATVTNPFSWQTSKNYAFVVNGVESGKTNGTLYQRFGINQYVNTSAWAAAISGGVNGMPAGTYTLCAAWVNSVTNHMGPLSDELAVTITAGQRIQVGVPDTASALGDTQVNYIQFFIRQDGVRNVFLKLAAGTSVAPDPSFGWPVTASSYTFNIDITQTQLNALIIPAPDVNDNYPIPANVKFLQNHNQRMFAADETNIYWSEVGGPENFNWTDRTTPVGENDGEPITGLTKLGERLVIFKATKVYVLEGNDPANWNIRLAYNGVGCVSYASIGTLENTLFWMAQHGPYMWADGEGIADIGTQLIGPEFDAVHINPSDLVNSVVVINPPRHYVAFAITPLGETTNSVMIPFDYRLKRWMSSEWRMVDVRSATITKDTTGRAYPVIGDYSGFLYRVGVADSDGLPSGVVAQGTITSATSTTITVTGAGWTTNALAGRYVYIWSSANGLPLAQRRRIVSNTATVATINLAFNPTPSAGNIYNIGGILFDWQSAVRSGGAPFYKKRIEFLFLDIEATNAGDTCTVEMYRDEDTDTAILSRSLTLGSSDVWGDDWGTMIWATGSATKTRTPIRNVGYKWQTRLLHMGNGSQLKVLRTAVQWQTKSKKVGNG